MIARDLIVLPVTIYQLHFEFLEQPSPKKARITSRPMLLYIALFSSVIQLESFLLYHSQYHLHQLDLPSCVIASMVFERWKGHMRQDDGGVVHVFE